MHAPRAILFDAEGVIVDTEKLWDEGQRVFLQRRGIAYDRDRIKHLLAGRSLTDSTEILKNEYEPGAELSRLIEERRTIMRGLFADRVEFVPGFLEFFARVKASDLATAVATSMSPEFFAAIDRRLDLRERFGGRVYFTSDVDGRAKPDPAIFLYAARALDRTPADCLVIEDSPAGVDAARAAGMRCVALTTTFPRHRLNGADYICEGFEQITEMPVGPEIK
ncbi:MAG: HAD family phosphatase [bacterium]|nr:HAD family phosphatase [bacterium]